MENNPIFVKYYTPKILLGRDVVLDILNEIVSKNKKILVFGLGYDSKIWYHANEKKNIWFVESNESYIKLNDFIDPTYIIRYKYENITLKKSFSLSTVDIEKYKLPENILQNAPYDLILVDGPTGFNDNTPGRLLPIYWSSKYLSKENTIIYVDDAERNLEKYCINKFLNGTQFNKLFFTTTCKRHCSTIKLSK
jgi:hypothetical protein